DAGERRRARPREAGDRQSRRGLRAAGTAQCVPEQPARAARGEARRPGDHDTGAGRDRGARHRFDGGAASVRRAVVEEVGAGEEGHAFAQDGGRGLTQALNDVERYLLLGLRLGRHIDGFVDAYYGPPELAARVDSEALVAPDELAAEAEALAADLEL